MLLRRVFKDGRDVFEFELGSTEVRFEDVELLFSLEDVELLFSLEDVELLFRLEVLLSFDAKRLRVEARSLLVLVFVF